MYFLALVEEKPHEKGLECLPSVKEVRELLLEASQEGVVVAFVHHVEMTQEHLLFFEARIVGPIEELLDHFLLGWRRLRPHLLQLSEVLFVSGEGHADVLAAGDRGTSDLHARSALVLRLDFLSYD